MPIYVTLRNGEELEYPDGENIRQNDRGDFYIHDKDMATVGVVLVEMAVRADTARPKVASAPTVAPGSVRR